jgi:hypothetical protein
MAIITPRLRNLMPEFVISSGCQKGQMRASKLHVSGRGGFSMAGDKLEQDKQSAKSW